MHINYVFEDLPLRIGTDSQNRPQDIALMNGAASIRVEEGPGEDNFEWYVDDIFVQDVFDADRSNKIPPDSVIFHYISSYLEEEMIHEIREIIKEEAAA